MFHNDFAKQFQAYAERQHFLVGQNGFSLHPIDTRQDVVVVRRVEQKGPVRQRAATVVSDMLQHDTVFVLHGFSSSIGGARPVGDGKSAIGISAELRQMRSALTEL